MNTQIHLLLSTKIQDAKNRRIIHYLVFLCTIIIVGAACEAPIERCTVAADCPGEDTPCGRRVCESGICTPLIEPAGTLSTVQLSGDCKQAECDGFGKEVSANLDSDVPSDLDDCTADFCSDGVPANSLAEAGTPCNQFGGSICNSAGSCVMCLSDIDCGADTASQTYSCSLSGTCMSSCKQPFLSCGASPTACETNSSIDSQNCGACGKSCPARANATSFCSASSCVLSCKSGFLDCDLNPVNGCEYSGAACPCGNGVLDQGEQCDDNQQLSGDGCSATCQFEPFFQCTTLAGTSVCTKQETICNDGIDNDADGNTDAADSDCFLPAYFPSCGAGQALHVYRAVDVNKAIPDRGMFTVQVVATLGGTIQKAATLFNITHPYDADVDLYLQPPGGAMLEICTDSGSAGDNFSNTVLDSTCSPSVQLGTAPFNGCFAPETSFNSLNNTQAAGAWKLQVGDDGTGDTGTLLNWALALCTIP